MKWKLNANTRTLFTKNDEFHKHRENRSADWKMAENGFWGLRACRKQWGRSSTARCAKSRWKTTRTLKHILKFHRFWIGWITSNIQIIAEKASNRAKKTGIFTCISMGRLFSRVLPSRHFLPEIALKRNFGQIEGQFHTSCIYFGLDRQPRYQKIILARFIGQLCFK